MYLDAPKREQEEDDEDVGGGKASSPGMTGEVSKWLQTIQSRILRWYGHELVAMEQFIQPRRAELDNSYQIQDIIEEMKTTTARRLLDSFEAHTFDHDTASTLFCQMTMTLLLVLKYARKNTGEPDASSDSDRIRYYINYDGKYEANAVLYEQVKALGRVHFPSRDPFDNVHVDIPRSSLTAFSTWYKGNSDAQMILLFFTEAIKKLWVYLDLSLVVQGEATYPKQKDYLSPSKHEIASAMEEFKSKKQRQMYD